MDRIITREQAEAIVAFLRANRAKYKSNKEAFGAALQAVGNPPIIGNSSTIARYINMAGLGTKHKPKVGPSQTPGAIAARERRAAMEKAKSPSKAAANSSSSTNVEACALPACPHCGSRFYIAKGAA